MGWRDLYPYESRWMDLGGPRMHYVKEGQGSAYVMLHGNPTWSFMYRDLIREAVAAGHMAVAPDLVGCGLSDKPRGWDYCLASHIDCIEKLIDEELGLEKFTLVMHDWGGGIGMGYAVRHPEKIERIVLMNTAAFPSTDCPKRIYLCKCPLLGPVLVQGLNLLVETALKRGPCRKLPQDVEAGYRYPYGSWGDRAGVLSFPRDIPLCRRHRTWAVLSGIESRLHLLGDKPISLMWGERDFCFHMGFFRRWRQIYPNASAWSFPDASHYLLEDAGERIMPIILGLAQEPGSAPCAGGNSQNSSLGTCDAQQ